MKYELHANRKYSLYLNNFSINLYKDSLFIIRHSSSIFKVLIKSSRNILTVILIEIFENNLSLKCAEKNIKNHHYSTVRTF